METYRRFISLLRKAQFLGYCASIIFLLRMSLLFICFQIEQLFQHFKSYKHLITMYRKSLLQLQIAYFEIFGRFIWLLRKSPIFLVLSNSQLFMYCKSTSYFTPGKRLHNCLLSIQKLYGKFKTPICIEKVYVNFKSPIWKYSHDSNGYCAKPNF